jgi:WD40 repeat protein
MPPAAFRFKQHGDSLYLCDWDMTRGTHLQNLSGLGRHPIASTIGRERGLRQDQQHGSFGVSPEHDFLGQLARSRWELKKDGCRRIDLSSGESSPAHRASFIRSLLQPDGEDILSPRLRKQFESGGVIIEGQLKPQCTEFLPNKDQLIACSPDGLIRLWDITALPRVERTNKHKEEKQP